MGQESSDEFSRFLKKMVLYFKVGMTRMTLKKAYRMLRYQYLTRVLDQDVPWLLEFSVTYACQCKCVHCSVGKYQDERKNLLDVEHIKRVLDQTAEIGIPKVDLFGGEPLLKNGIVDIVAHGSKLGLYMSVTSNGWLLTKELVKELKKAGISCINVSIDSDDEKTHDELRGLDGVFQKAVEGIKACHEEGIPCIASTYVTRKRIENFGNVKDDSQLTQIINFTKQIKATGLRILFPIISGNWELQKEKEFTEEEKSFVIKNIDPSFAFIEGAYSVKNDKKICQSLHGKMFNISPEGDMQICVAFPDTFGNVRDKPLRELLDDMYSHPTYLKNKGGNCCSTLGLERADDGSVKSSEVQEVRGC